MTENMYEPPASPIEEEIIKGYTDQEVNALRFKIEQEQTRRARISSTPYQVQSIVRQYLTDGGSLEDIQAAIDAITQEEAL